MRVVAAILVLVFSVGSLCAQVIDFETLPAGTPADGMLIRDQFNVAPYWVTFELVGADSLSGPYLARVGPDMTAFRGPEHYSSCSGESSDADKPALGENVGCYFLTDDGVVNLNIDTLRICYTQPVRVASGELLDVDDQETWTVTALASDAQTVLDVREFAAGDSGTGNGVATLWTFDLDEDIHFIEIWGQKSNGNGVGIAFDNFSPASSAADLSVSKVGPPGTIDIGDTLRYTITVENLGPGTATNVAMADRLPQGVEFVSASLGSSCTCSAGTVECDLGTVGVGASVAVEIVGVLQEVVITNDASVTCSEHDPLSSNNSDTWHTLVNCNFTSVSQGSHALGGPVLKQNRPNPFNPDTAIGFSIPSDAHVRLRIVDASGRMVRELVDRRLELGEHVIPWDGLNDSGRRVASGVYFYQLESDGESIERKMIMVK